MVTETLGVERRFGGQIRLGIVEDLVELRTLLAYHFAEDGRFKVCVEAGNGRDGLGAIVTERPDVVLLDIVLPGMDGLQVLRKLSEFAPEVKVVVLSGFDDARVNAQARKLGASAYLHKGMAMSRIADVLAQVAGAPKDSGRPAERRRAADHQRDGLVEQARQLAAQWSREIVHEARGPLTVLRSCAGVLPRMVQRGDMDELSFALKAIERNVQRLTVMLDSVSVDAQLATKDLSLWFVVADVGEFVSTVAEDAKPLLDGHALVLDVEPGCLARIDEDRLAQALLNLLGNAGKFSPAGSPIEVSVRRAQGQVEVAVRDQGPGIPPGYRERVFERGSTLGHPASGTGLGLYLSRALVETHGGTLAFTEVDTGCEVVVRLPATEAGQATDEAALASAG